jgi:uncharacterized Zn finger protein
MFLLDIFKHNEHNEHNEHTCDLCGKEFVNHEDLIAHARHVHHHPIMKCHDCGKEFIHEKDRLHHVREERLKKWIIELINGSIQKELGIHNLTLMNTWITLVIISKSNKMILLSLG